MIKRNRSLDLLWQLPLASFVLAGATGFFYRLGLVGVDLWGLSLENIRHAHSHLMFFCWAVPLPMYFMIQKLKGMSNNTGSGILILMRRMALASLFFGFVSYPFFLIYGYRPAELAGVEFPFSVILSGLVMLCWYGFMAGYLKVRKSIVDSNLSLMFCDASLLILFISSLGAWGVAAVQFAGVESPLFGKALTHFFLATFTEGWIMLVLLGIVYEKLNISIEDSSVAPGLLVGLILFGAPLTFPYGISESLLNPQLLLAARAGGLLAASGLVLNLYVLVRQSNLKTTWYWKIILLLLALKAVAQLLVSILPSGFWLSEHGLRILYLHLILLGSFTLVLFTNLHPAGEGAGALTAVFGSVVMVLVSLIWLTSLWPQSWIAVWQFYATSLIAILPSLAALYYWYEIRQSYNRL